MSAHDVEANLANNTVAPISNRTFQPGCVLEERYEILSLLGHGGMCTVYKARHLELARLVAIKVLHPHLMLDGSALLRFQREAQVVASLWHDSIVKVHGSGVIENRPYMVIDYLDGISLATLLVSAGPLPTEKALPIFLQILDALGYAHEQGILHRDLKPSNIMLVGPQADVKVVDFGIAKVLPESGKEMQRLTGTDMLLGTVLYMSPEQCVGGSVDVRSEIYSLGCLMYEALTGAVPFFAANPFSVIHSHVTEEPANQEKLENPVGRAIMLALNKDPQERPANCAELKQYLLGEKRTHKNLKVVPWRTGRISRFWPVAVIAVVSCLSFYLINPILKLVSGGAVTEPDGWALLEDARRTQDPVECVKKLKQVSKLKLHINSGAVLDGFNDLYMALVRQGRTAEKLEATKTFRDFVQAHCPDDRLKVVEANNYMILADFDVWHDAKISTDSSKVRADCKAALSYLTKNPTHGDDLAYYLCEAHRYLAMADRLDGFPDSALRHARLASEAFSHAGPKYVFAGSRAACNQELVLSLIADRQFDEADKLALALDGSLPADAAFRCAFHGEVASAFAQARRYSEAMHQLDTAITLNPSDKKIRKQRDYVLRQMSTLR